MPYDFGINTYKQHNLLSQEQTQSQGCKTYIHKCRNCPPSINCSSSHVSSITLTSFILSGCLSSCNNFFLVRLNTSKTKRQDQGTKIQTNKTMVIIMKLENIYMATHNWWCLFDTLLKESTVQNCRWAQKDIRYEN